MAALLLTMIHLGRLAAINPAAQTLKYFGSTIAVMEAENFTATGGWQPKQWAHSRTANCRALVRKDVVRAASDSSTTTNMAFCCRAHARTRSVCEQARLAGGAS